MRTALSSLMGNTRQSVYGQQSPVSSDPDLLKLDTFGTRFGAEIDMKINIDQIATNQVNRGSVVESDSLFGNASQYRFEIDIGGKTHQFSVSTTENDTHDAVIKRIVDAINQQQGTGVRAIIERDAENNTSALTIQSTETGSDARFTIRDTFGDITSQTGVGQAVQEAQDAIFRINNGQQRTSQSNAIDLGQGIQATMLGASANTIEVNMRSDGTRAMAAVTDLVRGYNELINTAKSSDTPRAL
jgi:flagellar hook-associated protein 2